MRAFRFGVSVSTASSIGEWQDIARSAERMGFDVLSVADHIGGLYSPFEALMAAAAVTDRIHLSTLVLNNDLRHPALVARQAALLQEFSGGRFELGLGAGHAAREYAEIGLPFDPPAVRVARLGEAVALIGRLLSREAVTLTGEHYSLVNHRVFPVPSVAVPIMVGGNGRQLLRLAATGADIVGFTGLGRTLADGQAHATTGFSAASVDGRVALVREAAGHRFVDLELNVLVQMVRPSSDREATARELARRMPGLAAEEVLDSPFLLFGTPEEIAAQLRRGRERWGFTYFSTFWAGAEPLAEVIPLLR